MGLTTSQRAATVCDKDLIIFAGPGSGKTSTSVAKAVRILQDPGAFLGMMTFTTAAAEEIRERMRQAMGPDGDRALKARLLAGTFNSITLRHYNRHTHSPRKLLAPPARAGILAGMLRDIPSDKREAFTRALDKYQAALSPSQADIALDHFGFITAYLRKLDAMHAMDLAMIMRDCTLKMASGELPLLRLTHLIGDEMQDADEVQFEFMLLHSKAGIKTTLVADDDQTIYEWRNAMGYKGLQRFGEEAGAKTIVLNENFRSRENLVEHATALIAHNDPNRIPKNQRAARGPGGILTAVSCASLKKECEGVAAAIVSFRKPGESVAVLARTNIALWSMQTALTTAEVPFKREGPSIWETPELSAYLSLLRALVTLKTVDLMPALAATPLDSKLTFELAHELGPDCGDFLDGTIPDLSRATPIDRANLEDFVRATSKWRRETSSGMFDIVILETSDFMAQQLIEAVAGDDQRRRAQTRILKLLDEGADVLTGLKGKLSRRLGTILALQQAEGHPDAVRLLTMHSSKGLEFDTIFLIDGNQPSDGTALVDTEAERRLFYVALTRARERFIVSFSEKPSQFIDEAQLCLDMAFSPAFVR
jgi:ATP-dependent DNA helicase UvrD/PcrA